MIMIQASYLIINSQIINDEKKIVFIVVKKENQLPIIQTILKANKKL